MVVAQVHHQPDRHQRENDEAKRHNELLDFGFKTGEDFVHKNVRKVVGETGEMGAVKDGRRWAQGRNAPV
jgi:hypothetical protein